MNESFEGAVVTVTGGTRGIGFAVAQHFAGKGAKVAISSTRKSNVDRAVSLLRESGSDAMGFVCDVAHHDEVAEFFKAVEGRYGGRLDVCVCCAGIFPNTALMDVTEAELDRTFGVNTKGLFFASQEAARLMLPAGAGAIVHVGSMAGFAADPDGGLASYCASKAAVHSLTKSLASELGPCGIRVNAVAPGWIATEMNEDVRGDEALMAKYLEAVPLGRFGEADEVAELVAFLAGAEASFINGAVIPIDGGNLSI